MLATSSTCYDVIPFHRKQGKFVEYFVTISSLFVKLLMIARVRLGVEHLIVCFGNLFVFPNLKFRFKSYVSFFS